MIAVAYRIARARTERKKERERERERERKRGRRDITVEDYSLVLFIIFMIK